jgi:hypothetical protein
MAVAHGLGKLVTALPHAEHVLGQSGVPFHGADAQHGLVLPVCRALTGGLRGKNLGRSLCLVEAHGADPGGEFNVLDKLLTLIKPIRIVRTVWSFD